MHVAYQDGYWAVTTIFVSYCFTIWCRSSRKGTVTLLSMYTPYIHACAAGCTIVTCLSEETLPRVYEHTPQIEITTCVCVSFTNCLHNHNVSKYLSWVYM